MPASPTTDSASGWCPDAPQIASEHLQTEASTWTDVPLGGPGEVADSAPDPAT